MRAPAEASRRARFVATALLAAMAVLFVSARRLAEGHSTTWGHSVWSTVAAFAEAAMVGGLADWFAVTALFRHPLGLPIPHTAIIPENKDRIADNMAAFLRANFLTPSVVARRLGGLDAAGLVGAWLTRPRQDEPGMGVGFGALIADVLAALDEDKLGGLTKEALSRQIARIDLAPLLGQLLGALIAERRHVPLIESVVRQAGGLLEANEDVLRKLIHDRASTLLRWTGLDERLANGILDGLYAVLAETVVDPDHPLRRKIEDSLVGLAHDLVHDPELGARVGRVKGDILANPAFTAWLDGLWERGRFRLIAALRKPIPASGISAELGHALCHDRRLNHVVNRFVRRTMTGLASRYGDQIVRLVSDTVRRWDARTVSARIESAVGRDLQFIRINGTLVGGLVGLALHAIEGLF